MFICQLLQDELGNTPLCTTCAKGHLGVATVLLLNGAVVNFENKVRLHVCPRSISVVRARDVALMHAHIIVGRRHLESCNYLIVFIRVRFVHPVGGVNMFSCICLCCREVSLLFTMPVDMATLSWWIYCLLVGRTLTRYMDTMM